MKIQSNGETPERSMALGISPELNNKIGEGKILSAPSPCPTDAPIPGGAMENRSRPLRRRKRRLKIIPASGLDSQILRRFKRDRGNKSSVFSRPEVAADVRAVVKARSLLLLTSRKDIAQRLKNLNLTAVHLPEFNPDRPFLDSLDEAAHWYRGVFVFLRKEDAFNWAAFELAADIAMPFSNPPPKLMALLDDQSPVTPHIVRDALKSAVRATLGNREDNAINFFRTLGGRLASTPDLLLNAAKFAALASPRFHTRLIQQWIEPAGLDARLFRKYYREEVAEIKRKRVQEAIRISLIS